MKSLQNNSISCQFLVGQGYDGASDMSGYLHGAQEYIKKKVFPWLFMYTAMLICSILRWQTPAHCPQ